MSMLTSTATTSGPGPLAYDSTPRILVIDEEATARNVLSELLQAEGYQVVTARSGEEGIEQLRAQRFDVAIADLCLPEMDGIQTIDALKEVDPDLPVVVVTGHSEIESAIAALRTGACDFLLKPIARAQLRLAVSGAIEKHRTNPTLSLLEATHNIAEFSSRQEMISAALKLAEGTVSPAGVGIVLVTPGVEGLQVHLAGGGSPPAEAIVGSLAQLAIESHEALFAPSLEGGELGDDEGRTFGGSALAYPLEARSTILGALVLWRAKEVAPFSAVDLRRGKVLPWKSPAQSTMRKCPSLSPRLERNCGLLARRLPARKPTRAPSLDTAREAIVLFDERGVLRDFNPMAAEMFGWQRKEDLGRNLTALAIPAALQDVFKSHLEATLRFGRDPISGCMEVCARRHNGEEFPMEVSTTLIETSNGRLLSTFARDISDRKRAEEQSRVQTTALVAAANGVLITDREGSIIWANPAFTRLTGYTLKEVRGRNPRLLKSGGHKQEFYEKLWNTILAGGPH